MTKLISVAGISKLATAGVLVVAGAALNRLFRPFDASVPRQQRRVDPHGDALAVRWRGAARA